ncbi:hypothetical protein ACFWOB_14525 [Streptomyces sp. NPDC058420]|uniref:hypothetical protein n=1 Tax=Streptomyces sp. NPDC058420 TaxID=3346489 RepID=UPI003652A310
MGQTPAQKAARAARGQQPKKRPGKAQREAIKQAQAAKKTAVKTAVPLPRGTVRAAYPGTCPSCFRDYDKGTVITKVGENWGHPGCAPREPSAAEREFERNKARIDSGETFRSRKPSDWRRGASVSSTRPARWTTAGRCGVGRHGRTVRTRGGQGPKRTPRIGVSRSRTRPSVVAYEVLLSRRCGT